MGTLSAPGTLWNLYLEYLCNYQPTSWVASTAYTFRVLAFVVVVPCVLLLLLDVTSYVIARTLGVIEDTKASTSETLLTPSDRHTPSISVHDDSAPDPARPHSVPPPIYFNPAENEGSLRLSGVGMFSPAPSQPPSPILARGELHFPDTLHGDDDGSGSEESYALLDRDSGSEDAAVTLRKRARPRAEEDSES